MAAKLFLCLIFIFSGLLFFSHQAKADMQDSGAVIIPDGYGLTAVGFGSDDKRCFIYLKTASLNSNKTIDTSSISSSWGAPVQCAGGGGLNAERSFEAPSGRVISAWSWGADTSGGKPGDDSHPDYICAYQEYMNLATGAVGSGGTCNVTNPDRNIGSVPGNLKAVARAPAGRVIVGIKMSLGEDATISYVTGASKTPQPVCGYGQVSFVNNCEWVDGTITAYAPEPVTAHSGESGVSISCVAPCSPLISWTVVYGNNGYVYKSFPTHWGDGNSSNKQESNLPAGSYSYTLDAYDDGGNRIGIAAITVNVTSPTTPTATLSVSNLSPSTNSTNRFDLTPTAKTGSGTISNTNSTNGGSFHIPSGGCLVSGSTFLSGNDIDVTCPSPSTSITSSNPQPFSVQINSPTAPGTYTANVQIQATGENGTVVSGSPKNVTVSYVVPGATTVDGLCGTATTASSQPTANLCSQGTPSAVTGSGPWTWTCNGTGSPAGSNANCSTANVGGNKCGTAANKHYPISATGYGSDTLCISGYHPVSTATPPSTSIAFPASGAGVSWWCNDNNEVSYSPSCTAWHDSATNEGPVKLINLWISRTASPVASDWVKTLEEFTSLNGVNTLVSFTYAGDCGGGYPSKACAAPLTISCGNTKFVTLNQTQINSLAFPYTILDFCDYPVPGTYTVSATGWGGAYPGSTDTAIVYVKVVPPTPFTLNPPAASCLAATPKMTWTWDSFPGATSYKVHVGDTGYTVSSGVTSYITNGYGSVYIDAYIGTDLRGQSNVISPQYFSCVGDVTVNAKYNDSPWSGDIKFKLVGPTTVTNGSSDVFVPTNNTYLGDSEAIDEDSFGLIYGTTPDGNPIYEPYPIYGPDPRFKNLQNGSWKLTYLSGGPAAFQGITQGDTQDIPALASVLPSLTYTLNFSTAPTPGQCGSSNNGAFSSAPTTNLCSVGSPSSVSGGASGPWIWDCSGINGGNPSAACNATHSGTVAISVNPASIYTGDSSTLTWSSSAASCAGTNFTVPGSAPAGNIPVSPASTTIYTVTCGGQSASATLTVKKKPIFIED